MKRWLLTVVALAVATAAVAAGDAGAKVPAPKVKIHLPAPGDFSVGTLSMSHRRTKAVPHRIRLRFPRAHSLPPSVRVLTATRVIRTRHKVTYALAWIAINRKTAGAARSRAAQRMGAAGEQPLDALDVILTYFAAQSGGSKAIVKLVKFTDWTGRTNEVLNAGSADANKVRPVEQTQRDLFSETAPGAGTFDAFNPPNPGLRDPTLDTSHFDDGHAFGWKSSGTVTAFARLTDAAIARKTFEDLARQVEQGINADIDGDGDIGGPQCKAGSQETAAVQIAPQQSGDVAWYSVDTKIPRAGYYARHGIKAGCNHEDDSLQVNIDLPEAGAWNYDYGPFPSGENGPDSSHSGAYCPFTRPDGSTKNVCDVSQPFLGFPPPSQGFLMNGWEQDPSKAPTYSVVFSVSGGTGGSGGPIHAVVSWRLTGG